MKKLLFCLLIAAIWFFSISIFAKEETNDNDLFNKLITAKTLKFIPLKSCTADWEKRNPKYKSSQSCRSCQIRKGEI